MHKRWNARTWVRHEAETLASTYDAPLLEQYDFILEGLKGGEYHDELTDEQVARAIRACQNLLP